MSLLIDLHNDAATKIFSQGLSLRGGSPIMHLSFDRIRAAGYTHLVFAAYCDPHFRGQDALEIAQGQITAIRQETALPGSCVRLVTSWAEAEEARARGLTAGFLSVEGGYAVENESDLGRLEKLRALGMRIMTLTHSQSTGWAGTDSDSTGLTSLGQEVVRRLNDLGVLIDTAHACTETILDTCRISRTPVLFTHGGARALAPLTRNITNEAIRAIAGTGGVIGLSFFPPHASGKIVYDWHSGPTEAIRATMADPQLSGIDKFKRVSSLWNPRQVPDEAIAPMDALVEQMDYLIGLVGEDHVALGSDYDGIPFSCRGLEDPAQVPSLLTLCRKRGYSDARIEKIAGGNAARVLRTSL